MGANFSCFNDNPEGATKNVSDVKLYSLPDQDLENEHLKITPMLPQDSILRIQAALRGYQTRKLFKPDLDAKKEDRRWFQIELKYPQVKKSIQKIQNASVSELEKTLPDFTPILEEDGVKTQSKPALQMDDGSIYKGDWDLDGRHHGTGTLIRTDGTKIVGSFKKGILHGIARMIQPTGAVFEGEFKDGVLHGSGKILGNHGGKFEGNIVDGKLHGSGMEEWPDGMKYEGEYENGLRHGIGKIEFGDGDVYEGDFFADKIHGNGTFRWKNGNSYTGQWAEGKMKGKGVFKWKDGRVYEGSFLDDQKHGDGTMTWPDGKKYSGEWKNGQQHGIGSYRFLKDKQWVERNGIWEKGSRKSWISKE